MMLTLIIELAYNQLHYKLSDQVIHYFMNTYTCQLDVHVLINTALSTYYHIYALFTSCTINMQDDLTIDKYTLTLKHNVHI